ncbi:hypothetical protein N7475_010179 [Penicillium sp. IBT 31633x]|nr:hypothetical protein N7475_010179 [Penicillium sp. IBT 31633x]
MNLDLWAAPFVCNLALLKISSTPTNNETLTSDWKVALIGAGAGLLDLVALLCFVAWLLRYCLREQEEQQRRGRRGRGSLGKLLKSGSDNSLCYRVQTGVLRFVVAPTCLLDSPPAKPLETKSMSCILDILYGKG